ncbi:hypothetical protein ADIMK_0560 [Marinobacterium lacunae]|uniref:HTH luxR-type domain-containing protein n=1 Tax=Marinobacterium lacunae TaxID=1232683 RepID=A0A081G383_9GAMM|nr:LuxR C-terminal-related transcriptional regulator [Marinobacterium lacunae]KEA65238.1 hypothetical protein ADIMK_0560 [Marinobacterium lacunae]
MATYEYDGLRPEVDADAYVHEQATLIGQVSLSAGASVWPHAVLRGSSNKAIATDLALGEATVKTHLIRIFRKTEVKKRSELVAKVLLDLNG